MLLTQKNYLLNGIRQGFLIAFNPHQPLKSAVKNMQLALVNPESVTEYLHNELREQRVAGPLTESLAKGVHVSRFGLIPKQRQHGKWRLILDFSHPPGYSINDGVAKELSTLQYASVDDATRIITDIGPGTKLAKIDIVHAY